MDERHIRRVRYSGTHPKRYEEKYKELNPEKYADTIEHVKQKGMTPAGMHISIMVKEILDFLEIKPGQQGLDVTLGYGGHTQHMLEQLKGQGKMVALDVDPIEIEKTRERLSGLGYGPEILTIVQENFANVDLVTEKTGKFDFILADLGVSSMQIDNPSRGFTYKYEGPLDLRLNPAAGISAAERLREVTKEELAGMLTENSDEPYAQEIAAAIVNAIRKGQKIETTTALRELIEETFEHIRVQDKKEAIKKSCQRTFQALRIDVNNEFEVLESFLDKLPSILNPSGKVAVLTFHSGEDRLVKKAFKYGKNEGLYESVASDVIRPSAEECAKNSRAHSTKMRWAIRA